MVSSVGSIDIVDPLTTANATIRHPNKAKSLGLEDQALVNEFPVGKKNERLEKDCQVLASSARLDHVWTCCCCCFSLDSFLFLFSIYLTRLLDSSLSVFVFFLFSSSSSLSFLSPFFLVCYRRRRVTDWISPAAWREKNRKGKRESD